QSQLPVLGHLLSSKGPERVQCLLNAPPPRDRAALLSTLGVINYLRPFLPGLEGHISPFSDLRKSGTRFAWSDRHDLAWKCLLKSLAHAVLLKPPIPGQPYTLYCDASKTGIGGSLWQD